MLGGVAAPGSTPEKVESALFAEITCWARAGW